MIEKTLRRLIQAAIESFPISEAKKAELLQKIKEEKRTEWKKDETV